MTLEGYVFENDIKIKEPINTRENIILAMGALIALF